MSDTSFKKGEDFENFVENNLFSNKNFTLIRRTSSKKQNEKKYAEDTKKPDFEYRCNKTLNEF